MPTPNEFIDLTIPPSQAVMLVKMLHAMNTAPDDYALLDGLVQPLKEVGVFSADLFFVELDRTDAPAYIEIAATWQRDDEPPDSGARYAVPDFPLAELWLSSPEAAQLIADVTDDARVDKKSARWYADRRLGATAIVPLNHNGAWSAGLICNWQKPHAFSDQEVMFFDTLATVAAPVIENYRRTQAVQHQSDLLQLIFDNLPDATVYVKDTKSRFMALSPVLVDVMGLNSAEDAIGKDDFEFFPEELASKYYTDEQELFKSERPIVGMEEIVVGPDGVVRHFLTSKSVIRDHAGNVIGLVGTGRDISRQKEAEMKLEEERNILQTLIDNIPDQIYFKDADSRFTRINRAQAHFLGLENPDDAVGKTDMDFLTDLGPELLKEEKDIMASGQPLLNRLESYPGENGKMRWIISSKVPVWDKAGNVVGIAGISRDITVIREAEQSERRQREVIEAQRQVLRELSTPIIPIMDRVLVMPLIGNIDTARARDIMRAMLSGISDYRAKTIILDVTGVPVVDSGVAEHLNKTIQAARLKGAHTIITGISDAVAETIVDLGIDWSHIETLRDLQSGLIVALSKLGLRLERYSDHPDID
jgi:rsbT co-antagonist protein RsbR